MERIYRWIKLSLFTLTINLSFSAFIVNAETVYRYVDKSIIVDSLLERVDPKATIIDEGGYKKTAAGVFSVSLPQGTQAPDVVYLKKQFSWLNAAATQTPPTAKAQSGNYVVGSSEGPVTLAKAGGQETQVTPGSRFTNGDVIRTGKGGKASLIIPGMRSVTSDQNSVLSINQLQNPSNVSTEVKLNRGTVFLETSKFQDSVHSFRVTTPLSIAAARGTEYLVSIEQGVSVICIIEGGVDVTKADKKPVAELTVTKPGDLLFQAVPELNARQYSEWLYAMVGTMDRLNQGSSTKTFTGYFPVIRKDSAYKTFWDANQNSGKRW
ncbi:MAG: FecR family protein [Verrucomicrobiota bacterium]